MREYFLETERIGFSIWTAEDLDLAMQLWGEPDVTRYICAIGVFSQAEILNRLEQEVRTYHQFHVQYWPIFEKLTGELIGCCGLRAFTPIRNTYEIGFHLRKKYWKMGYGFEAAQAVVDYGFTKLKADRLFAGHHPQNTSSQKLLTHLGFRYVGDYYYEPTGLYHPSYEIKNQYSNNKRQEL